jgi:small subunit ribosomal protein S6
MRKAERDRERDERGGFGFGGGGRFGDRDRGDRFGDRDRGDRPRRSRDDADGDGDVQTTEE